MNLPQGINKIEIFFTSNDINTNSLFRSTENLISVDLSEFTTSSNDISYMFTECSDLQKVIMKNFITSNINNVNSLFNGCTNLEYVNFDNCDFSSLSGAERMFYNCGKLKSIDLSGLNSNNFGSGIDFTEWFSGTNGNNDELLYLDLQNFEFKLSALTNTATLDLSNKPNLKYLNIKNYKADSNIHLTFKEGSVITICMLSETFNQLSSTNSNQIFGSWTLINNCSHPSFQGQYKFCHENCQTCFDGGNDENHKCTTCISGYYKKLNDEHSNCYNIVPERHYFDEIEHIYKPCYSICQTCSDDGTEYNHNCDTCISNYYRKYNDEYNNCYSSIPNHYLEPTIHKFKPCYYTCLTCNGDGTEYNHNCDTCISNYYKKYNDEYNNCYNITPEQYYFNETEDIYKPCFSSCLTCSGDGTENSNNCIECLNNYYKKEFDLNDNCYNTTPDYHYFDDIDNLYKPCYNSCYTCYSFGNSENHNCITCKNEYHKKYGEENNICYNENEITERYYLDNESNVYKECYYTCNTCSGKGTKERHNCLECLNNKTFIIDEKYKTNCYDICENNVYYFDDSDNYHCLKNDKNDSEVIISIVEVPKKEIIENLTSLLDNKSPKSTYLIQGEDYNLLVSPVNTFIHESSINIDFSNCLNKLKQSNPDMEYRVVQINMKNNASQNLIDNVEYKI